MNEESELTKSAREVLAELDGEGLLVVMMLVHVGPQVASNSYCCPIALVCAARTHQGLADFSDSTYTATPVCREVARLIAEDSPR